MTISLNKLHFPVTTLGYGRRVGIWFQGCSIRCPGCVSRDTWEKTPDKEIELEALMEQLAPWLAKADGVTISGGEPFDQPEALEALCQKLKRRFAGDLLVYSGHPFANLTQDFVSILQMCDVLISEPYQVATPQTRWLRGSDNQHLHLLSPLARERYGEDANTRLWQEQRQLDLVETDGDLWLAGIPAPGMLSKLEEALTRRGHATSQRSDQAVGSILA